MAKYVDGSIGLAPYTDEPNTQLVKELYAQDAIEMDIVSFSLNHLSQKSFAIFGKAPTNFYRGFPTTLQANTNYK